MKKTLLVAAMMASFTGAAVAQNTVTLYGRLAPAMVYQNVKLSDKAATSLGVTSGTRNQFSIADGYAPGGSLFVLKGVEDLGGGLKVSFKFEQGLSTTTGGLSTRISALSVSSTAWGSIQFGKDLQLVQKFYLALARWVPRLRLALPKLHLVRFQRTSITKSSICHLLLAA